PDRDAFAHALLVHLRNVQRHYATLFENAPVIEAGRRALRFPSEADDRETLDRLTEMGFRRPLETSALVRRWDTGSYGARVGSRAANSPKSCRCCFNILPVRQTRMRRSSHSTGSLPGCTAAGGCFRCCDRIPI